MTSSNVSRGMTDCASGREPVRLSTRRRIGLAATNHLSKRYGAWLPEPRSSSRLRPERLMTDPRRIFEQHRPNPGYCLVIRPMNNPAFHVFWDQVARAY